MTYAEKCKAECEWCAKGYFGEYGSHSIPVSECGNSITRVFCTAPTRDAFEAEQAEQIARLQVLVRWQPAEWEKAEIASEKRRAEGLFNANSTLKLRISELERENAELEKDKALLDEADRLMITNGHPANGYAVKYPGHNTWHREKTLRKAIQDAMNQPAQQGEVKR